MSVLEFLFEALSNIGNFTGNSKSEKSTNFSDKKVVFILQFLALIIGFVLLYIEGSYIFSLKEVAKSMFIFFGLSILFSIIIIFLMNRFKILYSLNISQFFWLLISFTLFLASLLFGMNYIFSDLFFARK